MARPCCIDADLVGKAKEIVAEARDLETLRSAQAVLLPALLGATLEQTAVLLGIGRATVNRLQRDLRCRCAASVKPVVAHGGRHHELMTLAEEREFLSPWAKSASAGGRRVAASVVYRMLARHGWRKVAPDTRHPKSDSQVQENWKKTARKLGNPRQTRECQRTTNATDVPGRGALRTQGAHSKVLGLRPGSPGREQWLRAGICLGLWRSQSAGGGTGRDDLPTDEYGADECVSLSGERGPP